MSIWNRYMQEHQPARWDAQVPGACERFVEQHAEMLLDERLEPHLVRHLLNLVDYGVINEQVVQACHTALLDALKTYTRKPKQGHINRIKLANQIVGSPVKSPGARSPQGLKGKRSPSGRNSSPQQRRSGRGRSEALNLSVEMNGVPFAMSRSRSRARSSNNVD
jgi:hypothetical protein